MAINEKELQATIREMLRVVVTTMIDVSALKILQASHGPRGLEGLKDAQEVARQQFRPFLDTLDRANDQSLLDMFRELKLPPQ